MKIYYIGAFPPDYGGVTIKNQNLYDELARKLDIRKIDMNRIKHGNVKEVLRFLWAMLTGKQYVIGLAGQKNRRQFTELMYRFKRRAMSRSVLIVMSGIVEDMVLAGPDFLSKLNTYRGVYLEFPGMAQKLETAGVTNAAVYPNGRPRPKELEPVSADNEQLHCVFFSLIEPEKGVDRIFEAAKVLPGVQFHFYGKIVQEYRDVFLEKLQGSNNISYHGIFQGSAEEVYSELGRYDVLLLPTRRKTEGLPGVLIEAKIAGLPCVISNLNYNRQIVQNGVDGFLLDTDAEECLASVLQELSDSRKKLLEMKFASRVSAEKYYIDVCVQDIISRIQER